LKTQYEISIERQAIVDRVDPIDTTTSRDSIVCDITGYGICFIENTDE
jgi:hypothetical protein